MSSNNYCEQHCSSLQVKEEISAQKNDFEVADYFKRGYNNMLGKVWEDDLKQEVIIKITIR